MQLFSQKCTRLTHWGRVTHICVSKLTTIGSDNGLSPGRRQAIIWTNDGVLLIRTLRTNFSEILSKINSFSFKTMHLKMSSAKGRLFSLGLNELRSFPFKAWMESNAHQINGFITVWVSRGWVKGEKDSSLLAVACRTELKSVSVV